MRVFSGMNTALLFVVKYVLDLPEKEKRDE